ncbi:hypothetical protein [Thermocatellispora tengchongensis]|uniref:hypothetical protein n=1 Tax=Thermocatellispora tengchongensis TaxID=1073253 RepID=UPI003629E2B5
MTGRLVYHQIQFGHRVMFVRAGDVTLRRTAPQAIHAAKTSSNPPPSASRVRRTPEER